MPQELLFDQMRSVITRDLRLQGGASSCTISSSCDRDERAQLQPLPARRYTSLVLDAPAIAAPRRPRPVVAVEKRALTTVYARLAGGMA